MTSLHFSENVISNLKNIIQHFDYFIHALMFTIELQVLSRLLGKERLMFGWAMLRPHLPGGMRVCKPEQAESGLLNCLYTADLAGTLWCIVLGNSLVSLNQSYI